MWAVVTHQLQSKGLGLKANMGKGEVVATHKLPEPRVSFVSML